MIDKFFVQTNDTILDFLSEIGKDKEVFSCFSGMEIDGYRVYFYAIPTEIVLVLMDIVDEDTIKIVKNKVTLIEPVKELYNHAKEMRRFFVLSCQFDLIPAIHLMLLTNSRIVNYPKVLVKWQKKHWRENEFGFTVLHNIHGLKNIEYGDIPVNIDLSLEASAYWTKWQTYLKNRGWFDWADDQWSDWPQPSDKRYKWKGGKGHLISDEFEE